MGGSWYVLIRIRRRYSDLLCHPAHVRNGAICEVFVRPGWDMIDPLSGMGGILLIANSPARPILLRQVDNTGRLAPESFLRPLSLNEVPNHVLMWPGGKLGIHDGAYGGGIVFLDGSQCSLHIDVRESQLASGAFRAIYTLSLGHHW